MKLTLQETLSSRNFYRNLYRMMLRMFWLSLGLNVGLTIFLFYMVLQIGAPLYYATNSSGAGFVSRLITFDVPNPRQRELLKSDPPEEMKIKPLDL